MEKGRPLAARLSGSLGGPPGGHLAAAFTITVWGLTFASTKLLLVDFTPVEILFYRLLLATLALWIFSPPRLSRASLSPRVLKGQGLTALAGLPALAGLCGVTLFFLFQNIALTYTLAANVSVLLSVSPLFIALLNRLVFGEKLRANFLSGFAAAMAGMLLIAFNGSLVLRLNPLGDLLALLAALAWAAYSMLIKQIGVVAARAGAAPVAVLPLTRQVFTYGLIFLLPVLPLADFQPGLARLAQPANLANLLFLGVGASALCYLTWNTAVQRLGPVKTAVYIFLVPVVTIAASYLILGEQVTLVAAAGAALILAGLAISERGRETGTQMDGGEGDRR